MFKGSEKVERGGEIYRDDTGKTRTNRDAFYNKRSQYYRRLRDKFYNTYRAVKKGEYVNPDELISLSSNIKCIDELRSEVCRIPKKPTASGKFQVMSKLDMAKKPYEIPSPNMADALMMGCYMPDTTGEVVEELEFEGW
jgi:phage terminase large subunit